MWAQIRKSERQVCATLAANAINDVAISPQMPVLHSYFITANCSKPLLPKGRFIAPMEVSTIKETLLLQTLRIRPVVHRKPMHELCGRCYRLICPESGDWEVSSWPCYLRWLPRLPPSWNRGHICFIHFTSTDTSPLPCCISPQMVDLAAQRVPKGSLHVGHWYESVLILTELIKLLLHSEWLI